jgi:hypothetical protein
MICNILEKMSQNENEISSSHERNLMNKYSKSNIESYSGRLSDFSGLSSKDILAEMHKNGEKSSITSLIPSNFKRVHLQFTSNELIPFEFVIVKVNEILSTSTFTHKNHKVN